MVQIYDLLDGIIKGSLSTNFSADSGEPNNTGGSEASVPGAADPLMEEWEIGQVYEKLGKLLISWGLKKM